MARRTVSIQVVSENGEEAPNLAQLLSLWEESRLKEAALIAEHHASHKPFPATSWLAERSIQEKNLPGAKWKEDRRRKVYIKPAPFSFLRFLQKELRAWYFTGNWNTNTIGGKI